MKFKTYLKWVGDGTQRVFTRASIFVARSSRLSRMSFSPNLSRSAPALSVARVQPLGASFSGSTPRQFHASCAST